MLPAAFEVADKNAVLEKRPHHHGTGKAALAKHDWVMAHPVSALYAAQIGVLCHAELKSHTGPARSRPPLLFLSLNR